MKRFFEMKLVQQDIQNGVASHKLFDMRRCQNKDLVNFPIAEKDKEIILNNNYCPDITQEGVTL
jgi:hypothetical protein